MRASTSAGIFNRETGERFPGSGGLHVYLFVKDGSDIPRFLEALQKRAWLAGYGWIMVGGRGQLLVRSIVDTSVGPPERLSFEGPPLIQAPLAQDHDARQPAAIEGKLLDTRTACPPLSADEQRRFDALAAAAKKEAKPEAEAAVEKAAERIAQDREIDVAAARTVIQSSLRGVLTSHHLLEFDDDGLGIVSVADVLADPERFHEKTLADPLEGRSYGRGKAKVYRNAFGSIVINSFAHGGGTYTLQHDANFIEARISEAGEGAPFVLAGLMPHARALDAVTHERLRNLAAKLGKVSRRAVSATVAEEIGKARREAADAARERRAGTEPEAGTSQPAEDTSSEPNDEPPQTDPNWKRVWAEVMAELNARFFVASMGGSVRIASLVRDDALGRDRLVFLREADLRLKYAHRHYKVGVAPNGRDIVLEAGEGWLCDYRRRTYERIALSPTARARLMFTTSGGAGASSPRPDNGRSLRRIC